MSSGTIAAPYGIHLRPGWKVLTLGELANYGTGFIQTGPFGSQLHARDYREEGIPVVMPQQLGDNVISLDGIARISESDRDRLRRHIMQEGDIVFSRRGDVTRRAYIGPSQAGWLCGTGCLLIRIRHEQCDPRFLAYFFSLPQFKEYITQKAVGATMPNLNQSILSAVPVVMPPRQTQDRIVATLAAYDDLIVNNTRRIKLLEEAARLLYEEWFVRLRFPGHEHTPIHNGIPEGWQRRTLQEVGSLHYGKALKTDDRIPGPVPVYGSSGIVGCHEKALVKGPGIIVGRKGNVGSVHLSLSGFWPIDTVYYVEPDSFSYYLLHNLQYQNFINGDAAVPGLNRNFAHCLPVLLPSKVLRQEFERQATVLYAQINKLQQMNDKLAAARDLLLPRLMSGEVAV